MKLLFIKVRLLVGGPQPFTVYQRQNGKVVLGKGFGRDRAVPAILG